MKSYIFLDTFANSQQSNIILHPDPEYNIRPKKNNTHPHWWRIRFILYLCRIINLVPYYPIYISSLSYYRVTKTSRDPAFQMLSCLVPRFGPENSIMSGNSSAAAAAAAFSLQCKSAAMRFDWKVKSNTHIQQSLSKRIISDIFLYYKFFRPIILETYIYVVLRD